MDVIACSGSAFPSPSAHSRSEVQEYRAGGILHENVGFMGMPAFLLCAVQWGAGGGGPESGRWPP